MVSQSCSHPAETEQLARVRIRLGLPVGAACVLLAFGLTGARAATGSLDSYLTPYWSVPADQAPLFVSDSTSTDLMLSDARFAAQGWRWSPGTYASIAVLVRVDSLRSVTLARIGGLYGP